MELLREPFEIQSLVIRGSFFGRMTLLVSELYQTSDHGMTSGPGSRFTDENLS